MDWFKGQFTNIYPIISSNQPTSRPRAVVILPGQVRSQGFCQLLSRFIGALKGDFWSGVMGKIDGGLLKYGYPRYEGFL